ncbi:hypothetical protein RND81_09G108500 [Saponaria officinalis]
MMEAKEAEQSCRDKSEFLNNEQAAVEDTEMGEEKPREDKEEAEDDAEQEEDEDEETEESENEDDEQEKNLQHNSADVSNDGRKEMHAETSSETNSDENMDSPVDAVENSRHMQTGNVDYSVDDGGEASLKFGLVSSQKSPISDEKGSMRPNVEEDIGMKVDISGSLNHQSVGDEIIRTHLVASPNAQSSPSKVEHMEDEVKDGTKKDEDPANVENRKTSNLFMFDTDTSGGGDAGTEKEQAAFMMELHKFHKDRGLDFKPPKFYGVPLNLLKLWRAVLKLGGYDEVTACKYWRQVGESFRPPKTCTTISWTFRIFYEKALLEYERYRTSADGISLPTLLVPVGAENQGPGSGRALRDSAARAMQGWHSQRILDNGEVSDPIIKEKNSMPLSKKEKPLKSLGSGGIIKRKNPSSTNDAVKSVQMKLPKIHSDATVIDIGSPADWVKINVRATRDCYEVYALVPGLLREEVRVQSDPAGRLVISGEPENPDNPWNVTPFKKVVSLPSRIDPHQTSAVVTLHGQLFVRVPFEQYD